MSNLAILTAAALLISSAFIVTGVAKQIKNEQDQVTWATMILVLLGILSAAFACGTAFTQAVLAFMS